jgi:XisI protein
MDTEAVRSLIESILTEYSRIPYAYGEIEQQAVFDRQGDHYLLVNVGWEKHRRIHGCIVHVDIRDGKIWIQYDGTEEGIANELVRAGIPKESIVLGFQPLEVRPHTGFAVA